MNPKTGSYVEACAGIDADHENLARLISHPWLKPADWFVLYSRNLRYSVGTRCRWRPRARVTIVPRTGGYIRVQVLPTSVPQFAMLRPWSARCYRRQPAAPREDLSSLDVPLGEIAAACSEQLQLADILGQE